MFLAFAAIALLLLLRYSHTTKWDQYVASDEEPGQSAPKQDSVGDSKHPLEALNGYPKEAKKHGDSHIKSSSAKKVATQTPPPKLSSTSTGLAVIQTVPHVVLPDRSRPNPKIDEDQEELTEDIHPIGPPGRQEHPAFSAVPTTIHWEKQVEHFPVPTESLIRLPTGAPATIPKIQHIFNDETPDAKINREKRQKKVKEEFQKAWTGYKQNAWLHDELSPVSGKFRDPFCGWAATLVDSLDTLWIMGFQEEFEEAARAVDLIDFTTSPRSDIPVFETTIRYLGGLLAAYDVSGGIYRNLLDKAVELADILMGAFDTPNRMPILFYRWKPTFASQPHRASQRSNLAELGSLSMEFTRLAQLTKDPRYYDAVARVTNALSEWQDRGTKLDGVFPENVDASGCNRSVPLTPPEPLGKGAGGPLSPANNADPPQGYEPSMPKTVAEPKPKKKNVKGGGPGELEVQIVPGEPSKAQIVGWDDRSAKDIAKSKRDLPDSKISNSTEAQAPIARNVPSVVDPPLSNRTESPMPIHPVTGLPLDMSTAQTKLGNTLGDWDCTEQGLEASTPFGRNKFSMGGGQDSTYEYFPKVCFLVPRLFDKANILKQYLLLAGREEKYRKMYLKTIDAVREWMLYRPMTPGNRDILFSGSVTTEGKPDTDLKLTAEVEHLTCFIGGMVGMGAKIFGIEGDLEIAKKLADGCVWAYESTASGIMPEGATVLPCVSAESCTWNETAYWDYLDPFGKDRDNILEEYIQNKAAMDAEKAALAEAAANEAEEDRIAAQQAVDNSLATPDEDIAKHEANAAEIPSEKQADDIAKHYEKTKSAALLSSTHRTEPAPTSQPASIQKRQSSPREEIPKPITHSFENDVAQAKPNYKKDIANDLGELKGVSSPPSDMMPQDKQYMEKVLTTEAELRGLASGRQAEVPLSEQSSIAGEVLPDPLRPLSHIEFVEARIKQEALPPGFVTIRGRKYILR